ncbi:MAG: hypothetical protein LBC58_06155 [Clostridiales Family XIII bacterium]|jgi:hypothetical protein|nr:hypothetical protein [Clostridiales Family XIII bacterium]
MGSERYFSLSGKPAEVTMPGIPAEAKKVSTQIDDSIVSGTLFNQVGWYTKPFDAAGLFKHESDELLIFAGGDIEDPENLNAEIELQLENDVLTIDKTGVVFVPGGCAHGNLKIKRMDRPVFYAVCHMNTGAYEWTPTEVTAEKGTYAGNFVDGYKPVSGKLPEAPEGFLQLLIWLDGEKAPGAPYMELVWFKSVNETGPAPHAHDFDELIGFIGSDPEDPENLNAEVTLDIAGDIVHVQNSCIAFCPEGTIHSPITVPALERPIYHFSIGNGGDYVREGNKGNSNIYKPE